MAFICVACERDCAERERRYVGNNWCRACVGDAPRPPVGETQTMTRRRVEPEARVRRPR